MLNVSYEARNSDGQLLCGMIPAASVEEAGLLLSDRNLFVVRLAVDRAHAPKQKERGRATRAQVAWCMAQLSVMVETGIPLGQALACLARQASDPNLRTLLERVSASVQEGRSLSEALDMFPRTFPPTLVALIRASEMTGSMSHMLQRSSVYLMNDLRVMKQIRGATIYPVFTLVLCIAITAFLLIVILPRFADIFASRQAALPLPTRMLMALSGSLVTSWHWWLAAILTVIVGGFIWTRTRLGRRQLDGLVLSVPLLSGIFHSLYQYRTFRTFSLMIEAGVPILDVVQLAQEVVSNTHYCALWKGIDTNIRNGESLSTGLLASDLIPESISQMIDSGERSGKLGVVFDRVADFVELEYNQSIKNAMQLIEPAMILGMGAIIGFVAASLMLPLFRISQVVAQ